MKAQQLHGLAILLLSVFMLATQVRGHGYMLSPKPRNVYYNGGSAGSGDIQSMSAGGTSVERENGHGLCGDLASRKEFMAPNAYGPTDPQMTVYSGEDIEIKVKITAHHWGWFEFRLCVPDDGGVDRTQPITQACLNKHVLKFNRTYTMNSYTSNMESGVSSPADYVGPGSSNYRFEHSKCPYLPDGGLRGSCCRSGGSCSDPSENEERWVLPKPQDEPFVMRFKVPEGIECERCVLQWFYETGNSPDSYPEGFWNCADIQVIGSGQTSAPTLPTPAPTNGVPVVTPTTSTPATTAAPTALTTPSPTKSGEQTCHGTGVGNPPVTDEWCQNAGCAQAYIDAGYCYLSNAPSQTSAPTAVSVSTNSPTALTMSPTASPTSSSTDSSSGCYGTGKGNPPTTDSWCQAVGCAQVYVDGGYCTRSAL
mmetsp:Transcript_19566/g.33936  ORF Transcript_19566/g.33936 Transcript_19566/m.33936 type:complete len:423 (+) Transcript_19566:115-1383(+)